MTLHHFCVCQPLPREVQEPAGSSRPLRPLFWFCSGWHLFLAHFTCCTMVNLGDSFKIQPVLSSAWKTPGAQIGNAKETMRIALRSFALFLRILVLQPHVHSILHVSLHHPMQHSSSFPESMLPCQARLEVLEHAMNSMRGWVFCLRHHCCICCIWHGIRVFIRFSIWPFAPPNTNYRNAVTQAEKRMLNCHAMNARECHQRVALGNSLTVWYSQCLSNENVYGNVSIWRAQRPPAPRPKDEMRWAVVTTVEMIMVC